MLHPLNRWCLGMTIAFVLLLDTPFALASDPLIMGIFPRRNAEATIKHFKPLANYLSDKLQRPVKLETSSNFASFWQNVSEQRYDIVHYNQYHYVESHKLFGYDVFARNEEFGRPTIAGAIVIRTDSGIKNLADLKGKKILFGGGRKAMVAYIATTHLLREAGLKQGDYTEVFATNPPNACMGTYLKQADAGGVGDVVLELPMIKRRINTKRLAYIASGTALPHIPWAFKKNLDEKTRTDITKLMSSMHENDNGRAVLKSARITRINQANDEEYDVVRKIIFQVTGKQF